MLDILIRNSHFLLLGAYPDGPLGGLALTLILSLTGLAFACPLGVLLALCRVSPYKLLRVPSAVPQALEGLKVGLGLALVGAVIGEISASAGGQEGLAWRILEAAHRLETARSFAALAALAMIAGVLHLVFRLMEKRTLDWWRG